MSNLSTITPRIKRCGTKWKSFPIDITASEAASTVHRKHLPIFETTPRQLPRSKTGLHGPLSSASFFAPILQQSTPRGTTCCETVQVRAQGSVRPFCRNPRPTITNAARDQGGIQRNRCIRKSVTSVYTTLFFIRVRQGYTVMYGSSEAGIFLGCHAPSPTVLDGTRQTNCYNASLSTFPNRQALERPSSISYTSSWNKKRTGGK